MSTAFAVAPAAPGRLGEDVAPADLLTYLDELGRWRDRRKAELDALDEASLRSPHRDELTGDVLLSMALWQAVAERHDEILAVWDSGRVLADDRRRITTLLWGRLDQGAGDGNALSVSLPEACRLSDGLAAGLRSRLGLEGSEPDVSARVRALRAGVERVRDQVGLIPEAAAGSARSILVSLDRRLVDVTERARRGADVGGLLGPLELDLATAERDLIVAAAQRDRTRHEATAAATRRDELAASAAQVRELADRASALVAPAPRLGVPDPTALGDIPTDADELAAYRERLDRVARALDVCRDAYAASVADHADLQARLADVAGRLDRVPPGDEARADLDPLLATALALVAARPTPLPRAHALVRAIEGYLDLGGDAGPTRRGSAAGTRSDDDGGR